MPQGSTRINAALTNLAVQYKNTEYIAGDVLKTMPVAKESDSYWIYANDFRLDDTLRANGSKANMVTMSWSTGSYVVSEHALKDVITDRDRMNTDAPLQLDRDLTEYLVDKIMIRQEYEAMKLLFTTTSWGNNATLTSATSWKGHTTTADPVVNAMSATGKIIAASGKKPNTLVMGWGGLEALKDNENVYSRIQYVERSILTPDIIAALFEIGKCYVGTAVYDTAAENETESKTFIWGSDALFAYFDPSPGLRKATAGLMFRVTEKGNPYRVKKWREEEIEGDYIEVQTMFAPKAVATACSYLFKTVAL